MCGISLYASHLMFASHLMLMFSGQRFHYLLHLNIFSVLENVSGLSMHVSCETSGWMKSWGFKWRLPSVSTKLLLVVSCVLRNSDLEEFESYMCILNVTDRSHQACFSISLPGFDANCLRFSFGQE